MYTEYCLFSILCQIMILGFDSLAEDYYRYIAEFRGTDRAAVARASEVYQEAIDAVQDRWRPCGNHLGMMFAIHFGIEWVCLSLARTYTKYNYVYTILQFLL